MSQQPQCITVGPIYSTYAKQFIKDIQLLRLVPKTKNLFINSSGHPITKVEIFGVVTEVNERNQFFMYEVDDCTSKLKCIAWKSDLLARNKFKNSIKTVEEYQLNQKMPLLPTALALKLQNIIDKPVVSAVSLGCFVNIQGKVQISKYDKVIEVSIHQISIITCSSLDFWMNWTKTAMKLNEDVYGKNFHQVIENNDFTEALSQGMEDVLKNKLQEMFFSTQSTVTQCYGYEILEMDEVNDEVRQYFNGASVIEAKTIIQKPNTTPKYKTIKEKNMRGLSIKCIIHAVNHYVSKGKLIKQNCTHHGALTGVEELDAFYRVTEKCHDLVKAIKEKQFKLNDSTMVRQFKRYVLNTSYDYLRKDSHIREIVSVALNCKKITKPE